MKTVAPIRVLLADADPDTARLLQASLESVGAVVCRIIRGEDVLPEARKFRPDIIATDLVFRGDLDGFGVIDLLRRDPVFRSIPIVVLTDYGMAHDAARARSLGASDALIKSEHAIKEVVSMVLAHAHP